MIEYTELSAETRAIFNPALIAILGARAAQGYEGEAKAPMPIALCLTAVGTALFHRARDDRPSTIRPSFAGWLQDNPEIRYNIGPQLESLGPHLKAGIIFGVSQEILRIVASSSVSMVPRSVRAPGVTTGLYTQEVESCIGAATFFGRWFARSGTPGTVMALLGVTP